MPDIPNWLAVIISVFAEVVVAVVVLIYGPTLLARIDRWRGSRIMKRRKEAIRTYQYACYYNLVPGAAIGAVAARLVTLLFITGFALTFAFMMHHLILGLGLNITTLLPQRTMRVMLSASVVLSALIFTAWSIFILTASELFVAMASPVGYAHRLIKRWGNEIVVELEAAETFVRTIAEKEAKTFQYKGVQVAEGNGRE
jgi:hypothetical protein